jgi:predicted transporter
VNFGARLILALGAIGLGIWINESWFSSWKEDVQRSTGCAVVSDACRGCAPLTPPMRWGLTYWLRCEEPAGR